MQKEEHWEWGGTQEILLLAYRRGMDSLSLSKFVGGEVGFLQHMESLTSVVYIIPGMGIFQFNTSSFKRCALLTTPFLCKGVWVCVVSFYREQSLHHTLSKRNPRSSGHLLNLTFASMLGSLSAEKALCLR